MPDKEIRTGLGVQLSGRALALHVQKPGFGSYNETKQNKKTKRQCANKRFG
jgi:hypothetical protein